MVIKKLIIIKIKKNVQKQERSLLSLLLLEKKTQNIKDEPRKYMGDMQLVWKWSSLILNVYKRSMRVIKELQDILQHKWFYLDELY